MNKWVSRIGWLVVIFLFAWFHAVYAIDDGAPTGRTNARAVFPAEDYVTLLDASPAASTGLSTAQDLKMTPRETKCTVSVTGTAPTSWTMAFYSGPSSSVMTTQYAVGATQSETITSFPYHHSFGDGYGSRWWKVNNISTVGGDATTKYTVTCTGMK